MSENTRASGDQPSSRGIDRRTAIKAGAGIGAAGLLWAEPTIKGLARRPAYAQAGSACTTVETIPVTFDLSINSNAEITSITATPDSFCGQFILICRDKAGSFPGLVLSSAGAASPNNNPLDCETGALAQQGPFTFAGTETGSVGDFSLRPNTPFDNNGHRALFVNPGAATGSVTLMVTYTP